ncbi:MAG: hypothetical protein KF718_03575 [Polyangiaceae bacterium]|nr:hypothetical protein [Polyangiaceae bacterium]
MGSLQFDYADVSADPLARVWAEVPADVSRALDELELRPVGFAHGYLERANMHLVHEVRVSDDGLVQSVAGVGSPPVEFNSLLEDGTVLKTVPRPPPAEWRRLSPGMRQHPRDRHYYQALDASLADVLAHHRERVRQLAAQRCSEPVVLDTMLTHFAVRLRTAELRDFRMPWHVRLAWLLAVLPSLGAGLIVLWRFPDGRPLLVFALAGLGMLIVFIPAIQLSTWQLAPRIMRLFPGPPPVSAGDLFVRAASVPRRRLPRETA